MLVYDDLEPIEKIKICDKRVEILPFLDCINNGRTLLSSGYDGLQIVKILRIIFGFITKRRSRSQNILLRIKYAE